MRAVSLDHVGIAVRSPDGHPLVSLLAGGPLTLTQMRSGVAIARFGPDDRVELVTPGRPESPIDRFLENRGPGLHHVAFQVDEPLAELIPALQEAGIEVIGEVEPSSDGRPSLFLHPGSLGGVLVELVEGPRIS